MSQICIGIVTYNRLDYLQTLVQQVCKFTSCPYDLVVADDGSTDGTVDWCRKNGIRVITGPNQGGPGRGKNFILYYFLKHTSCPHVIILEDDCRIWEYAWERDWVLASRTWGHVNWCEVPKPGSVIGSNTPADPYRVHEFGGHCTITRRDIVETVGFIDPRFKGYGGEHVEWTWRIYRVMKKDWGTPINTVPGMSVHVGVLFGESTFKSAEFRHGIQLMLDLVRQDPTIYRDPWITEDEMAEFLSSIDNALLIKAPPPGLAGERCPLCQGLGQPIGVKDDITIRQCCGNLLAWAWNSEAEYEAWYTTPSDYHSEEQAKQGQKSYWDRDEELMVAGRIRMPFIKALRPDAKTLLDIGAGTGAFVAVAAEHGFQAWGIEPSAAMCEQARLKDRELIRGFWSAATGQYDLITMLDVFEHLTRPRECLLHLQNCLNEGGLLMIEMPEAGCPQNVIDKLEWKHIRPRQHLCIWSESAAKEMFSVCGFSVEMIHRPLRGTLGKIAFFIRHI